MNPNIPPHLRWQCRRGMLELDVLLGDFLQLAYANLNAQEQAWFEKLLACSDQDLFIWLMGRDTSSDPELQYMVNKVREHARNKH